MGGQIDFDSFAKVAKNAGSVKLSDSLFKDKPVEDEIFKINVQGTTMPDYKKLMESAKNYESTTNNFKETIASIESASSGLYNAYNPHTGAAGKYQFLPSYHKDVVRQLFGASWNEFKRSPELQERYMDYWTNVTLKPQARQLKQEFPNSGLSESQLMALVHFKGAGGARKELSNPALLNKATSTNISSISYLNRFV